MLKTLIVYAHLLSACVAVGILLMQDLALAKTRGNALSASAVRDLTKSAEIMFIALVLLWISGLSLVLLGYLENPQQYLMNEKLWAKFTVVAVLTLNGIALHYFSFPRVTSRRGLLGLPTFEQILVVLTGALSSVSWLFACYLGIARNWNYTADYSFVMFIYSGLLVSAFIVAGEVLRAMRKAEPEPPMLSEQIRLNASRKFD
jgi:membrane-associated HD superfamily phosphohydrolase